MVIDFTGYAGDCLITGRLALQGERLTDHLNAHSTVELEAVVLEDLLDGRRVEVPDFRIERAQLCAVLGAGPRGARFLRIPTDEGRLQAQIGPYAVLGRFHGPAGATTLRSFTDRDVMVPLTDATIAYVVGGILEVRDTPTLIVNRDLAAWFRETDDEVGTTPTAPSGGGAGRRGERRPSLVPVFGPQWAGSVEGRPAG